MVTVCDPIRKLLKDIYSFPAEGENSPVAEVVSFSEKRYHDGYLEHGMGYNPQKKISCYWYAACQKSSLRMAQCRLRIRIWKHA